MTTSSSAFPDPPPPAALPVAVIGGGPAGLMAAEVLTRAGVAVDLFDTMPSVGRKFLLAGKGGLNLTHSEPTERLLARYAERSAELREAVTAFDGAAVRQWAADLGIATFVGTSGRVFPADMKSAPLLRAWLHRLRASGLRVHARHRWTGWAPSGALRFETPAGEVTCAARATVLAPGGASWPRLGSDGGWVDLLAQRQVDVAPILPANCGFDVAPTLAGRDGWSDHLRERFAGEPLKTVVVRFTDCNGRTERQPGEFVLTETGVEGSLIYAFSGRIRDVIRDTGHADIFIDLLPQHSPAQVMAEVAHPRGSRSLSSHLRSRLGLHGAKTALLHELLGPAQLNDPASLAHAIKALPLRLVRARPVAEAISTAGGVRFEALDARFMLRALPGVFCAGEMLDWEAPTGGYLLTACMATGRAAGQGALQWLRSHDPASAATAEPVVG